MAVGGYLAFGQLGRRAALGWIFCCSLAFYAWWKPILVLLLVVSILLNFFVGKRIVVEKQGRAWLIAGLAFNLGLLCFFKYANFFSALLGMSPPFGGIYLPLGISFFTFQQIMYLVDTHCGDIGAVPFLDYACFISFFAQLIAGPIVHHAQIIPQL
ncbi:MAG TPA: MBOAT family protein, partial [Acidocella sp.]|nr:MBOAT family protein [Acidocella sp.]